MATKSKKRIPILPLELDKATNVAKKLIRFGDFFSVLFPSLEFELEQAEFKQEPREWISIAFFTGLFYFFLLSGILGLLGLAVKAELSKIFLLSLPISFGMGFVSFIYIVYYPKLFMSRKVKQIEKNLSYALYHLLIEIRSGVPLFTVLVSISKSNYGTLSKEMQKVINEITTGKSEIEALEDLAEKNPSLHFRRTIWQIVNALKSGADIGGTIKHIVDNLAIDQSVAIKRYGAQLNPIALMYMIFAVIFPTLGITFLLVISSFIGLGFNMDWVLFGILGFLVLFQFMIIGIIKSKRPVGIE